MQTTFIKVTIQALYLDTMQNGYLLYPIKGGYSMSEELNKDTLHELFKDFKENPSDYFEPIDWGEPQGNEVW